MRGAKKKKKKGVRVDKKKRKKGKKRKKEEGERTNGEREKEKKKGRFSQSFDGRNWTVREEKLIHASRATRGYQNLGVSSSSTR